MGLFYKAQDNQLPPNSSTVQMPTFSTPEISKLFRYSDFPNISSIGGTDIEIPIYTIKIDGMEVPVKLKYDTKGIKVADIASDVGLGWNLVYGGNIKNEVRDMDDFLSSYFFFDPNCQDGYMAQKDYRVSKGYLNSEFGMTGNIVDYQIDSSPDFYLINAPGLNDKFYLDPTVYGGNHTPRFLENKNSQSISSIFRSVTTVLNTRADNPYYIYGFAGFKIKNGQGYEYSFNDPQGSAINFLPQSFSDNINGYPPKVDTWRLSEISSPYSSKKISYIFENFENKYLNPTLNINTFSGPILDNNGGFFATGTGLDAGGGSGNKIIYSYNLSNKRIKTINFEEGSINFVYSGRRLDYDGNTLSKIEILDKKGQIIKKFDLSYSYFQPQNPSTCMDNYACLRLRLDKITNSSSGNYIFSYGSNNSNQVFPKRSSSKVDFLGFFNNNATDFQLFENLQQAQYPDDRIYYYSQLEKDNYLPFQLNNIGYTSVNGTVDRASNENSLIGLLTDITYPTGGKLMVQYENDDFDYLGETYKLGTSRIKKFTQIFNNGTTLEKNYSYKQSNGKSAGQIAFFNINRPKIGLEINNTAYVLYSKVEESISGTGKTVSEYSNFDEYPDLLEKIDFTTRYHCFAGTCSSDPSLPSVTSNQIKALQESKFPYLNSISQSHRRGLLTQKTIKDDIGNTISREMFKYKNFVKDSLSVEKLISNYTAGIAYCHIPTLKYTLKSKSYIKNQNSFLTKSKKESYLLNGIVTEESNYFYNEPDNLMITNQNIFSNGFINEKKYSYPKDLNQIWLINKNILGLPLIVTETFKKNLTDVGKVISKKEIIYPISSNSVAGEFALPLSIKSYNLDNTSQTDITYDSYDTKGNILQYTTKEGVSTAIIWGYNQTQPIAKIEGATYAQVSGSIADIVNYSNADATVGSSVSEQDTIDKLDAFRKLFPQYQITTYTYDPLIGVRSSTPPTGIREIYIYDTANRLESVIDVKGKILKEYSYKYKQ